MHLARMSHHREYSQFQLHTTSKNERRLIESLLTENDKEDNANHTISALEPSDTTPSSPSSIIVVQLNLKMFGASWT